jgi:hypothetical protein
LTVRGTAVAVGVGVGVGVLLGVGVFVWLGTAVAAGIGVGVTEGVVRAGGLFCCASDGVSVAVLVQAAKMSSNTPMVETARWYLRDPCPSMCSLFIARF